MATIPPNKSEVQRDFCKKFCDATAMEKLATHDIQTGVVDLIRKMIKPTKYWDRNDSLRVLMLGHYR